MLIWIPIFTYWTMSFWVRARVIFFCVVSCRGISLSQLNLQYCVNVKWWKITALVQRENQRILSSKQSCYDICRDTTESEKSVYFWWIFSASVSYRSFVKGINIGRYSYGRRQRIIRGEFEEALGSLGLSLKSININLICTYFSFVLWHYM